MVWWTFVYWFLREVRDINNQTIQTVSPEARVPKSWTLERLLNNSRISAIWSFVSGTNGDESILSILHRNVKLRLLKLLSNYSAKSIVIALMYGSCHIQNVLISVEYWNCPQTLNVYLHFAIWMGQIQSKLIYIFVTYELACL